MLHCGARPVVEHDYMIIYIVFQNPLTFFNIQTITSRRDFKIKDTRDPVPPAKKLRKVCAARTTTTAHSRRTAGQKIRQLAHFIAVIGKVSSEHENLDASPQLAEELYQALQDKMSSQQWARNQELTLRINTAEQDIKSRKEATTIRISELMLCQKEMVKLSRKHAIAVRFNLKVLRTRRLKSSGWATTSACSRDSGQGRTGNGNQLTIESQMVLFFLFDNIFVIEVAKGKLR